MIWLHEGIDLTLPGGVSVMGRIDCLPQTSPGRSYSVAHFVPAHQVLELEFYKNEKVEPYRTRIPLNGVVKRFE